MIDEHAIARHYGGEVSGGQALIPAIGHSKADRGVAIKPSPDAPDGVLVHCFNSGDPLAEKDRLREDGFLPERGLSESQPTPAARPNASNFWTTSDGVDLRETATQEYEAGSAAEGHDEAFVPASSWDYYDEHGVFIYRKKRIDLTGGNKKFTFEQPDGKPGKGDAPHVLYRLPELLKSSGDVYLAEGEKCADKLVHMGFEASSLKDLSKCDLSALQGRRCIILPDNDEAGTKEANKAAEVLHEARCEVLTITLPGLPDKGDIVDWSGAAKDLAKLIDNAAKSEWRKQAKAKAKHNKAFNFVAVDALEYRPPEFLIEEFFETETLGLLFGDPGCGKSFLAVDIALSVATGTPFHGRSTKQGPVFFIAGEGHNGLARRFKAWSLARRISLDGVPLFKSNRAAQFLDAESAASVERAVQELAALHDDPGLVIIDTLARNFGPGDENSTSDMGQFVAAVDDLKARFSGCTILIVHHTGHTDKQRARGAMALKGALDCEYRIGKNRDLMKLTNTKMKDAEPPGQVAFKLQSVDLGHGISSAALEKTDSVAEEKPLTQNQKLGLDTYVKAAASIDCWHDGEFTGVHLDQWRGTFYDAHTGDNIDAKRKAFSRVRKDLVERGLLSVSNDVYLHKDASLTQAIIAQRDTGQERDNAETGPDAEAGNSGTSGTHP